MLFDRDELGAFAQRSYIRGVLVLVLDVTIYLGSLVAMISTKSFGTRLLLSIPACIGMSFLFLCGHDACHNALTPSRRLNRILGRLAFLPTLQPFSLWELGHNLTHHRFTNLKGKDYVCEPLSKQEYDALSPAARRWYRFLRGPIGLHFYFLCEIWWKRMIRFERAGIARRHQYLVDRALVGAFFVFELAVLGRTAAVGATSLAHIGTQIGGLYLAAIVLPFWGWNLLASHLVYLHHTHERVAWYAQEQDWSFDSAQLENTVHVVFPPPLNLVLHRIMEHTAHHASTGIPLYRLRKAQAVLDQRYRDRVIVFPWTLRGFRETTRVCRLYDFEGRRWLDFQGTPANLTRLPTIPSPPGSGTEGLTK